MKYQHLSVEEREKIQEMLWRKVSVREIARVLNRSHSSILREIKKNRSPDRNVYTPRLAQDRALKKRRCRGREKRLKNDKIRVYVVTHLKERWSPEQIAGRVKIDLKEHISHEAIYQYIYAQIHRGGHGYLKAGCEDLRLCLRQKRKRRTPKGMRRSRRVLKPHGRSIETRPAVVDKKTRIGDWEGDSVESSGHKPGVNTLLERMSGMYFVTKVTDKSSKATTKAIVERFRLLPHNIKYTLTLDNGSENNDWVSIEKQTGLTTYFAHAYSSHERGANENTNGLLRDYFPKGTDFTIISDEEITKVEYALNTRPRKRLGWKTPLEVFSGALGS